MARNITEAANDGPVEITDAQLKKLSRDFRKFKEAAATSTGDAGQLVKDAVKDHGLNRNAFKWANKLTTMEPSTAQQTVRDFERYCKILGVWDQTDLVDEAEAA